MSPPSDPDAYSSSPRPASNGHTLGPSHAPEEARSLLFSADHELHSPQDSPPLPTQKDGPPPSYQRSTSHSPSPSSTPGTSTPADTGSSSTNPRRMPPRRQSSMSKPVAGGLRTPRTSNRVRFDLNASVVGDQDGGEHTNGHARGPNSPRSPGTPQSPGGWSDGMEWDEDAWAGESGQRERLLEGHEAPAVRVANSLDMGDEQRADLDREGSKSNISSAFMNMANSIIGAGIIGQAYAFKQAGLVAGVVLLVGLTVVVDWTIRLMVVNSKLSGQSSFQSTMEFCFGKPGLVAISLAQWAFAFGGMLAFCVIVGDTIPRVLAALFPGLGERDWVWVFADRRFIIVLFVLGVSYPLSLHRDISKLAKASTLALISMLIIIVTVITQGTRVDSEHRGSLKGSLVVKSGIFQAIGVISFAFVCHHNSLLIYGSLHTPTMDRFAKVTHYSTGVSMLACLTMALAGFLVFGDKTQGNVLNNFPSDNLMVNIARLCFGLNMLTTLPLEAFVCREVMLNYFNPTSAHSMPRHFLYTTGLVFTAVLLSLMTCDLGAVFELIGATSASALAYIMPPLCYIKLSTRSWRTWAAWACVVFGVCVLGVSSVLAIENLIEGGDGQKTCK